jgi:hypothetical protein
MSREIFSYLIPDPDEIEFRKESPRSSYSSYSPKYEVAFYRNVKILTVVGEIIENLDREDHEHYYLSRISKKKEKYRYYITKEVVDCIQVEYGDREVDIFYYDYNSKYVGKDLRIALMQVMYM